MQAQVYSDLTNVCNNLTGNAGKSAFTGVLNNVANVVSMFARVAVAA